MTAPTTVECICSACCYARKHPQFGPAPHATTTVTESFRDTYNDCVLSLGMDPETGWHVSSATISEARARCAAAWNARHKEVGRG